MIRVPNSLKRKFPQPQMDESSRQSTPLLRLDRIVKRFGNTLAIDGVSFEIGAGEVVALIGENGAGKSTLMKVLAGVVTPDSGSIEIDGARVSWSRPGDAIEAGIALIHQELNLHDNLSVAENIFLGREPTIGPAQFPGWINRKTMRLETQRLLDRVGLHVPPDILVGQLSIAAKQLTEIAKALSVNARAVVMDEPTSSLSHDDAQRLIGLIDRLRNENVAIVYISHRLPEVIRLADRVEVLRDGQHVATMNGNEIHHDGLVRAMVGRDLIRRQSKTESLTPKQSIPRLAVEGLRVGTRHSPPISFDVYEGEVVALVGLVGSGRTEIAETIFGIREAAGGQIFVNGQKLRGGVDSAIRAGLGLVPEDRKQTGLLIESDVRDNATLVAMGKRSMLRVRNWQRETTANLIDELGIKTASQDTCVAALSGGNQQKVAIAKWLPMRCQCLMMDEPTRGVDIAAKAEIYQWIDRSVSEGMAILIVTSEMEEVFAIADRVLVVSEGRIAGELSPDNLSEEAIMRLAVTSSADFSL